FEAPQRGHGLAAAVSPGRARVRLGIAPASYADDGPGIGVGDVYEGTAAYEAGLKVGDRLMKWNGQELTTVEAWMPILAAHKPGDEVEIVFIRDGREMTTRAVLKARDQGGR